MALVVEDGTGVPTAESYVSVAEADAYLLGHTLLSADWFALAAIDRARALRVASQWIDAQFGLRFAGCRESATQGLAWPRRGFHPDSGLEIQAGVVPRKLKVAVFEAAAAWAEGGEIPLTVEAVGCSAGSTTTSSAPVEKETIKVGPITISQEFSGGGQVQTTTTSTAKARAYPLVERILLGAEVIEHFERGAGSSRQLERF